MGGSRARGQGTCAEHCPYGTNVWIRLWMCQGSRDYPTGLACVEGVGAEIQ